MRDAAECRGWRTRPGFERGRLVHLDRGIRRNRRGRADGPSPRRRHPVRGSARASGSGLPLGDPSRGRSSGLSRIHAGGRLRGGAGDAVRAARRPGAAPRTLDESVRGRVGADLALGGGQQLPGDRRGLRHRGPGPGLSGGRHRDRHDGLPLGRHTGDQRAVGRKSFPVRCPRSRRGPQLRRPGLGLPRECGGPSDADLQRDRAAVQLPGAVVHDPGEPVARSPSGGADAAPVRRPSRGILLGEPDQLRPRRAEGSGADVHPTLETRAERPCRLCTWRTRGAGRADRLLHRSGDAAEVAPLREAGCGGLELRLRDGGLPERDPGARPAVARGGSRVGSGGCPLLDGALGRIGDAERPGAEHERSAHGRDHRERHRLVPQPHALVPQSSAARDRRGESPGAHPRDARGADGRGDASGDRTRDRSRPRPAAQHDLELGVSHRVPARSGLRGRERCRAIGDGLCASELHRAAG